jgi:hypothetical protein
VDSPQDRQHHQVRLAAVTLHPWTAPPHSGILGQNLHKQEHGLTRLTRYNAKRRHWRKTRLGI